MKKTIEKILTFILVICMCISVLPMMARKVNGMSAMSLEELQAKFPHDKYWNHAGNPGASNSVNNQDGWTNTPCSVHGGITTTNKNVRTCNGFAPDGTQVSYQCMGFAEKLGYDATGGCNPRDSNSGWQTYTGASAINKIDILKPGDIVRYTTSDHHSIYITAVNGENVTYADCNGGGNKCKILWDNKTTKSFLKSKIKSGCSSCHVRVAPVELSTSTSTAPTYANLGDSFTAPVLNKAAWITIANSYTEGDKPPVRIQKETGTSEQLWYFTRLSDGSYKIASGRDGKYLDVRDAVVANGTIVQTCVDSGSDAQKWYLKEEGGGYVIMSKLNTNYVLDLNGNNTTPGTNIQLWEYNGSAAQIWAVYRGDECNLKAPTLSVSAGSSISNTVFTWSESYGETGYHVKIWRNVLWDGDAYHVKWVQIQDML